VRSKMLGRLVASGRRKVEQRWKSDLLKVWCSRAWFGAVKPAASGLKVLATSITLPEASAVVMFVQMNKSRELECLLIKRRRLKALSAVSAFSLPGGTRKVPP